MKLFLQPIIEQTKYKIKFFASQEFPLLDNFRKVTNPDVYFNIKKVLFF